MTGEGESERPSARANVSPAAAAHERSARSDAETSLRPKRAASAAPSGAADAPSPARTSAASGSGRAKGVAIALAVVATASLAVLHQHREGSRAMLASDAAIAAKNPDLAIVEAFEAATHVAPFSPYAEAGHARLRELAEDAETRGDDDLAQAAWRAIRAAEITTKGPFSSDPARRAHAEAALARIDARRAAVTAARSPGLVRFDEGELAKRNARDPTPRSSTFAVLGAGAVLAILAAALLARAGFAFRGRASLAGAGAVAVAFALVAFALAR